MRASPVPFGALLLAALVLMVMPANAAEEADLLAQGRVIARETCAPCHAVEAGSRPDSKPASLAPAFSDIARMSSTTSASIKVFLKTPHANMPAIMLTEREIDALALYVLSLRTN